MLTDGLAGRLADIPVVVGPGDLHQEGDGLGIGAFGKLFHDIEPNGDIGTLVALMRVVCGLQFVNRGRGFFRWHHRCCAVHGCPIL